MSSSQPRSSRRTAPVYDRRPAYNSRRMRLSLGAGAVAAAGLLLLGIAGPAYRLGVPARERLHPRPVVGLRGLWRAPSWRSAPSCGRGARRRRGAAAVAAAGIVLGVLTAAVGYGWLRVALSAPPLHDVTTDLENPPAFKAVLSDRRRRQPFADPHPRGGPAPAPALSRTGPARHRAAAAAGASIAPGSSPTTWAGPSSPATRWRDGSRQPTQPGGSGSPTTLL